MIQTDQEIINTTSTNKSPSQRIWEVDFLRGFLLLFVVFDHFMFNLWYFCQDASTGLFKWLYSLSVAYYSEQATLGALQIATHNGFIMAFVFIAGVSSNFSGSNLKRAIKMSAVALLLSAVTNALSQVVYKQLEINFNVIHVLAVCCFVWCLIEIIQQKLTQKQIVAMQVVLIVLALALGVVGYYFHFNPLENGRALVVLIRCGNSANFSPADYLPLLPALSYYIIGACVGAKLYSKKQSLFGKQVKFARPICWLGEKSLYVYLLSQVVMFAFFYLFVAILPIL